MIIMQLNLKLTIVIISKKYEVQFKGILAIDINPQLFVSSQ
jgi:hypothetical protein